MNMKGKIFALCAAVIIVIGGAAGIFYGFENYSKIYYTQIDNTQVTKINDDDMKYEYSLSSYDEKGKEKQIRFKTSIELREDAFLSLEVRAMLGVHKWKEVQFDELPEKVQDKLKQ